VVAVLSVGLAAIAGAGSGSGPRFSTARESIPDFVTQNVTSSCCTIRTQPGCDDPACEAAVCQVDPLCCSLVWDDPCVFQAEQLCLVCALFCGDGVVNQESEQCEPPGTPTCDAACQSIFECPLSTCIGQNCELTQSLDRTTDGENTVACNELLFTSPQGWARCYDIEAEGLPPGDLVIDAVGFGVQIATAEGIAIDVVLYADGNGCPPDTGPDPTEFARETVMVDAADEGRFLTVPFPGGPASAAGRISRPWDSRTLT
jgi:hypothetical protein